MDIDELLAGLARRRAEKFGRLDETLWARLQDAKDDERIPIVIWSRLELPPAPYDKPTDGRALEMPDGEREVAAITRKANSGLRAVLKRTGVELAATDATAGDDPFVHATATAAQIRELARLDEVGVVHLDDQTEILDLGNSIAIARSDRAHTAGFDGTGIRVAVWETGPSVTTNLTFDGRFTTHARRQQPCPADLGRHPERLSPACRTAMPPIATSTRRTRAAWTPCAGPPATRAAR